MKEGGQAHQKQDKSVYHLGAVCTAWLSDWHLSSELRDFLLTAPNTSGLWDSGVVKMSPRKNIST